MKAFISKINKKLLESYPNIWNTKLVWMLSVALIIHVLFFILGFVSLTDPVSLHERSVDALFFRNGGMLLSLIISILMLVVWLIHLFRNNAFKAFYPIKRRDLFSQFLYFFIIIFFSTTYFYSYSFGVKSFIHITYSDDSVSQDVKLSNDTALFFSHHLEDYLIDKARYPDFFYNHFCETNYGLIDKTKPYYSVFEKEFQFYSVKTIDVPKVQKGKSYKNYRTLDGYMRQIKLNDSTTRYYYKDSVVDASKYIKTLQPSYKNYSETFYINYHDEKNLNQNSYYTNYNYDAYNNYTPKEKKRNKLNIDFLNEVSRQEIITHFNAFIAVANKYKIPHNLTAKAWAYMVYNPINFEVNAFIRNNPPPLYDKNFSNEELLASEKFYKTHLSNFFIESDKLKNTFENINDVKHNNPLNNSLHIFLWIAFTLATLIFIFRITGLRLLLFSVISVGVLAIGIAFIILLTQYIFAFNNNFFEVFTIYLIFTIGTIILSIPLLFYRKLKKAIVGVALNISISGFVLYLFLILGIISYHQRNYCETFLFKIEENCYNYTVLDQLGFNWSYILLISGFIFIYFYISIIKRWKALPEA